MSIFPKPADSPSVKPTRPRCPACGEEMVFVALVIPRGETIYRAWMCDCQYRQKVAGPDGPEYRNLDFVPEGIISNILWAREYDDGSFVMRIHPRGQEGQPDAA